MPQPKDPKSTLQKPYVSKDMSFTPDITKVQEYLTHSVQVAIFSFLGKTQLTKNAWHKWILWQKSLGFGVIVFLTWESPGIWGGTGVVRKQYIFWKMRFAPLLLFCGFAIIYRPQIPSRPVQGVSLENLILENEHFWPIMCGWSQNVFENGYFLKCSLLKNQVYGWNTHFRDWSIKS